LNATVKTSPLPTLDAFLAEAVQSWLPHRSFVSEPGWKILYVRVTRRALNGRLRSTIDLANLEATRKGKGAFRRLVAKLSAAYPDRTIFVELVQTERFLDGLLRMGFVRVDDGSNFRIPASLYLPLKGSG
jgi:hypothetical protein